MIKKNIKSGVSEDDDLPDLSPKNEPKRLKPSEAINHMKHYLEAVAPSWDLNPANFRLFMHGSVSRGESARGRKMRGVSANKFQDLDIAMVTPDGLPEKKVTEFEDVVHSALSMYGIDFSFIEPDELKKVEDRYYDDYETYVPLTITFRNKNEE